MQNMFTSISKWKKKFASNLKKETIQKKCGACFSVIGRGKNHRCTKQHLLTNLNSSIDEKTKDHVVAALLQEKLTISKSECDSISSMSLSRVKGKPMAISVGSSSQSSCEKVH